MDSRWIVRWTAIASVLALGCGTPAEDEESRGDGSSATLTGVTATATTTATSGDTDQDSATGQGTGQGTTNTTNTTNDDGTTEDDPTDPTEGPKFDLGTQPDAPPPMEGCGNLDFLFVIDNSGSMSAQQTQLLASFPGFITAIQSSLEGTVDGYHVGVVTSDNYSGNQPGCNSIGDLVTQTSGFGSLGQVCTPFADGNRFATEADDLQTAFSCMAQVGTSGSGIEQPVTATIAALDSAKAAPGACNENFLRDDAVLVVVVITDDPPWSDLDDAHAATDTTGWYQAIVDAKNGDPEAMVVIGFVPWMNVGCVFQNLESPNLINFVQSFGDQGVLASICEPDFGPVFTDTIATIVTTCENFDPPG